jgi:predicted alpha/beta superfamily hydrolase
MARSVAKARAPWRAGARFPGLRPAVSGFVAIALHADAPGGEMASRTGRPPTMMMRLRWKLALGVAALLAAAFCVLHFGLPDLSGDAPLQRTITSEVLGETREILVHLPASYGARAGTHYPVVYVLDGAAQSVHTAETVERLAATGAFPEAIVVGIVNAGAEGRNRDLTPPGMRQDEEGGSATGRSDRFLQFIRAEVIPTVEREFGGSGQRVLAGNSRGGLFVVDAMTRDPDLFDAYLANSPALWRDGGRPVVRLVAFLRTKPAAPACLYLSLGEEENPKMTRAFQMARRALGAASHPGFHWASAMSPASGHGDNAVNATPRALRWIAQHCGPRVLN